MDDATARAVTSVEVVEREENGKVTRTVRYRLVPKAQVLDQALRVLGQDEADNKRKAEVQAQAQAALSLTERRYSGLDAVRRMVWAANTVVQEVKAAQAAPNLIEIAPELS